MVNKTRKRDIVDRPVSFLEEMKMHLIMWKNDSQFSKFNKNTKDALTMLLDNVTTTQSMNNIEKVCFSESKDIKNTETNKFIAIYKQKYLELTDFNCDEKINNTGYILIRAFIEKLTDQASSVTEYLAWFFDDFLPVSPKLCPPTTRLAISNSITSKFFFDMKDKLKSRKENLDSSQKRLALMKLGAEAFEITSDTEFGKQLLKYGSNKITHESFKKYIAKFSQENKLYEIKARLEVLK